MAGLVRKPKTTSRVAAWTGEQVAAMIAEAESKEAWHDTAVLIRVAASTGLRFGELAGLTWPCIDLSGTPPTLRVERQLASGRFSDVKTDNARRTVPLDASMVAELRRYKLRAAPNERQLVFTQPEGAPLDPSRFHGRIWAPLLKAAELPHGRFHALRHSFASALINEGQQAKVVSALMGHASVAFTLDTYTDLWPVTPNGVAEAVTAPLLSGIDAAKLARDEPVGKVLEKPIDIRSQSKRKSA